MIKSSRGSDIHKNESGSAEDKCAAPPMKTNKGKEAEETTKEYKAMNTGDEGGRLRRQTEEIYLKRTLFFLLALVSVLFIILIITGIIGLIFVL